MIKTIMKNIQNIKRLKKLRKAAGLTLAELALKTGIPAGTIGYYAANGGVDEAVWNKMFKACLAQIKRNQRLVR